MQKKAAQFTNHTKFSEWETLVQSRTIACLCAIFKVYTAERSWKFTHDRWQRPYYLSRVSHVRKIRDRKQRRDIENYSFVNKPIGNWDQISTEALELTFVNLRLLEKSFRKGIINGLKWKEEKCGENHLKMQWIEVRWSVVKWGEV